MRNQGWAGLKLHNISLCFAHYLNESFFQKPVCDVVRCLNK